MNKIYQLSVVPLVLVSLAVLPALTLAQTNQTNGTTHEVSVVNGTYSPREITINEGDTITWTNNGTMDHTVTADDRSFDSGLLSPGESFSLTFDDSGIFPYYCIPHGAPGGVGMSGQIIVTADTDTNGNDRDLRDLRREIRDLINLLEDLVRETRALNR